MIKDLELLVELQAVDARIHELELQKEQSPEKLQTLHDEIKKARDLVSSLEEKSAALKADKQNINDQVAKAHAMLERSQERLRMIKTNKEYDAVHMEIEASKRTIASSEKRIAAVDEEITTCSEALEEARQSLETTLTNHTPVINDLTAKTADIDSLIASETRKRAALIASVGRNVARMYDHIIARRKNRVALAFMGEGEKACSICHKILEMQRVNEIRRGTRLVTCESCGSILVWKPAESSSAV